MAKARFFSPSFYGFSQHLTSIFLLWILAIIVHCVQCLYFFGGRGCKRCKTTWNIETSFLFCICFDKILMRYFHFTGVPSALELSSWAHQNSKSHCVTVFFIICTYLGFFIFCSLKFLYGFLIVSLIICVIIDTWYEWRKTCSQFSSVDTLKSKC